MGILKDLEKVNPSEKEEVERLNYKLRKLIEHVLSLSNYDHEFLDLYDLIGRNYERIKKNPRGVVDTIERVILILSDRLGINL